MNEEIFDIYDELSNRVGTASRRECHGNPALLHRTAHVVVFAEGQNRVLLQRRSMNKDIQPGKWDTAVGGHLAAGETYEEGARRELAEELGVTAAGELRVLFDAKIRNAIESEDVRVFGLVQSDGFRFQTSEIDEIRFWDRAELFSPGARKKFTPNLCVELDTLRSLKLI